MEAPTKPACRTKPPKVIKGGPAAGNHQKVATFPFARKTTRDFAIRSIVSINTIYKTSFAFRWLNAATRKAQKHYKTENAFCEDFFSNRQNCFIGPPRALGPTDHPTKFHRDAVLTAGAH